MIRVKFIEVKTSTITLLHIGLNDNMVKAFEINTCNFITKLAEDRLNIER